MFVVLLSSITRRSESYSIIDLLTLLVLVVIVMSDSKRQREEEEGPESPSGSKRIRSNMNVAGNR